MNTKQAVMIQSRRRGHGLPRPRAVLSGAAAVLCVSCLLLAAPCRAFMPVGYSGMMLSLRRMGVLVGMVSSTSALAGETLPDETTR